jgi:Zn-dependent protease
VKARVSAALGDPSPKKFGFLTWNPFKYFEPIGFFLMLFFRVGWGRPVITSPLYYRNRRNGVLITYTAPIVANLLVGMVTLAVISRAIPNPFYRHDTELWVLHLYLTLFSFGLLNIRLAVFNLIPVFPLAASKILQLFVSPETVMRLNHYEKPLQLLLFVLLIFPTAQSSLVNHVITTISNVFIRAVVF